VERILTIRVTKCTLVITEQELITLLAKDQELFQRAIKRGKAQIRAASTIERVAAKKANEGIDI